MFFTFVYFVCLPVQWATRKQEKVDLLLGIPVTHFILCNFALLSVLLITDFKSEGECMIFLIKLLGILLGFAFPVFTIKAIKESLQGKSREQVYVVLSSVCCGAIMLIVMGLLPNT